MFARNVRTTDLKNGFVVSTIHITKYHEYETVVFGPNEETIEPAIRSFEFGEAMVTHDEMIEKYR